MNCLFALPCTSYFTVNTARVYPLTDCSHLNLRTQLRKVVSRAHVYLESSATGDLASLGLTPELQTSGSALRLRGASLCH
jgi:N-acetylglutamate synthase-like GNAT family acetyltransferase